MENLKKKSLLSRLLLIKSDLMIVNPENFSREIKEKVKSIKEDVEWLVRKLIEEVKDED